MIRWASCSSLGLFRRCKPAIDAASVRKGEAILPVKSSPGLFSKMMFASMRTFSADLAPVEIEEEVQDGEKLPLAGGIEIIHTPGRLIGQRS